MPPPDPILDAEPEIAADEYPHPVVEPIPPPQTSRDIHQAVWRLAWPSVTMMLLQSFNGLMDTFFVGHLPNAAQALAATGAGGGIIFLMISLAMGITIGTTALVARFTGAREHDNAVLATGQSLSLGVALALLFGIPAYFGRHLLVGAMLDTTKNPEAARLCADFLGVALLATVPMFVWNVLQSAFRGIGDTRTPMMVTLASISTHILVNWLLIYGNLGFPRLGVQGAGVALAASLVVGMASFTFALWRSPLKDAFRGDYFRPRLEWYRRILRIGIPASVQALTRTFSMMLFTGMLARTPEGAAAVAALQIGIRSEGIAFMPGFGYGMAAAALVGQSLGARDPERAERYGWAATTQAIAVMSFMALVFYIGAYPIARLFSSDPMVIELAVEYLRINAWCEPFLALGMVLNNALQGAGETVRPTFITLFTMILARLPLAWFLMFRLNLHTRGAWLSMMLTTIVGGFLTLFLYRSGTWKRVKV
jgi:putative MATE family efflux protein